MRCVGVRGDAWSVMLSPCNTEKAPNAWQRRGTPKKTRNTYNQPNWPNRQTSQTKDQALPKGQPGRRITPHGSGIKLRAGYDWQLVSRCSEGIEWAMNQQSLHRAEREIMLQSHTNTASFTVPSVRVLLLCPDLPAAIALSCACLHAIVPCMYARTRCTLPVRWIQRMVPHLRLMFCLSAK